MKRIISILWAWSHTSTGDALIGVILYAAFLAAFTAVIYLAA